jgi:hypothetical protein
MVGDTTMKSLKPSLLTLLMTAPALLLGLAPTLAWSTHALAAPVTGQVTASPSGGEIEVDHHSYHIKANSPAEKAAATLTIGQKVSLMLDGPAGDSKSDVIGIIAEQGS